MVTFIRLAFYSILSCALLLLSMCITLVFNNVANADGLSMLDSKKPVIYIINQNPIAAFYGSQTSGYLSHHLDDYQVYANYIDLDYSSKHSSLTYLVNSLVSDILRIKPAFVFVHGKVLGSEIQKQIPDIKIVNLNYEYNPRDFIVEDPASRIVFLLRSMDYDYNKIYILHDISNKSIYEAKSMQTRLISFGISKDAIVLIGSDSLLSLSVNLRALNSSPRSVILNIMFTLSNTETGNMEYLPDIKEIVQRVNRKHLDIGFYRTAVDNECIVLDHNLLRIREYIDRIGKAEVLLKPLEIRASFNLNRMDYLNLKSYYLGSLSDMDDIIQ